MIATQVSENLVGYQIMKPVFTQHGNMLLNKGAVVDNEILNRLLSHNVNVVYVLDELSKGVIQVGIVDEERMAHSITTVKQVFEDVIHQEKMGITSVVPREHMALIKDVVDSLIEALQKAEDVLYTVVDLIGTDSYTYKHSVHVAILSILVSKHLHYSEEDIKKIALGALLHDIGKVRVDQGIITKPSALSPFERKQIEQHPELGYELMEQIKDLPYLTKQIILLHHEKLDGSGYPYGLVGIEIPEYVQIVTVCDMYDAMTSNRVYRPKMPIYKALDILMGESIYRIDPKIYRVLIANICMYPPGSGVVLSDGRIGIVSSYRMYYPSRPRVRVINLESLDSMLEVKEVNLEKEHTLFIEDTWDVENFKNSFKNPLKRNAS